VGTLQAISGKLTTHLCSYLEGLVI